LKSIQESVSIIKPESFQLVEKILSHAEFNAYLQAIRAVRKTTFRVNTIKSDKVTVVKILRESGISVSDFPLIENAFIVNNATDNQIMKNECFTKGYIYLQSLSSQIPPVILEPKPGDYILDLAAAPGSKTTQMAALMKNTGTIDAVEPDFIRKERLEYNINQQEAAIVSVFQARGEKFLLDVENKYDKILLDAPCSGEGRFNINDKSSYFAYRLTEIPKFNRLQVKLLTSALKAVKPGGTVVYSTCTLNTMENEQVLHEVCNQFQCEIVPLPKGYKELNEITQCKSSVDGVSMRKDIHNAIKIVPSQRIEGFFVSKIVKKSV